MDNGYSDRRNYAWVKRLTEDHRSPLQGHRPRWPSPNQRQG
uniref:Uncharacterized protein n=1 Tax=Manihot esculenta TaxID=3983 RepID=A0A199UCQ1_MANES